MEIKSVKVNDSATVNLGNYESRKIGIEIEVVIGPGENAKEVATKAFNSARAMVNEQIEACYPKRG